MMKLDANFDGLAIAIGTMQGIAEGVEDQAYIESLIQQAHATASESFNLAAASAAGAGYLSHMFEFGTAGITRGPVRFPDPTSPAARLWVNKLDGSGGQQNISFVFRPALAPNPDPTTANTGVPNRYLRKLSRRKYIFRNKALIMESGVNVQIRPKNGRLLFIPFYQEDTEQPRNQSGQFDRIKNRDRGFVMSSKPVNTVPGRNSKGNFTTFWSGWWETKGQNMMTTQAESNIGKDVTEVINEAAVAARSSSNPTKNSKVGAKSAAAKKKAEAEFKAKAVSRRKAP